MNEYVSVLPLSATLPPVATADGVTVPMVGVPPVPEGTLMVIEESCEVEAVVNV